MKKLLFILNLLFLNSIFAMEAEPDNLEQQEIPEHIDQIQNDHRNTQIIKNIIIIGSILSFLLAGNAHPKARNNIKMVSIFNLLGILCGKYIHMLTDNADNIRNVKLIINLTAFYHALKLGCDLYQIIFKKEENNLVIQVPNNDFLFLD